MSPTKKDVQAARRRWRKLLDPLRLRPDFPLGFDFEPIMATQAIDWLLKLERSRPKDGEVQRAARALKTWASLKTIYEQTRPAKRRRSGGRGLH